MGGLIMLAGLAAAYAKKPGALELIPLLLGIVTIAMPFVFEYTGETLMTWSAVITGVDAILASGTKRSSHRGARSRPDSRRPTP